MRAVLQRVSEARVEVGGEVVGAIKGGLCALIAVATTDQLSDAQWLAEKVVNARVFEDDAGKMNLSVKEVNGALLAISQFTLMGDLRRGNRPSFGAAMVPDEARVLFEAFCAHAAQQGVRVETGRFRAEMQVHLVNQGPVTVLIDSKREF
ncbi:MAG TPA: D-aminoacyl-tRNA deacylase [Polyangiaceae bacterium]|nr:D-aminoacyl-tRNA deacylase [Polyangiaceae bacterium]